MARANGLTRPARSRREGVSSQIFMKNSSRLAKQLQSKVLFSRCLMFDSVIRLVLVLRQIRRFYTSNSFLHLYTVMTLSSMSSKIASYLHTSGHFFFFHHILNLFHYRDILEDVGGWLGPGKRRQGSKVHPFLKTIVAHNCL